MPAGSTPLRLPLWTRWWRAAAPCGALCRRPFRGFEYVYHPPTTKPAQAARVLIGSREGCPAPASSRHTTSARRLESSACCTSRDSRARRQRCPPGPADEGSREPWNAAEIGDCSRRDGARNAVAEICAAKHDNLHGHELHPSMELSILMTTTYMADPLELRYRVRIVGSA